MLDDEIPAHHTHAWFMDRPSERAALDQVHLYDRLFLVLRLLHNTAARCSSLFPSEAAGLIRGAPGSS